MRRGVLFNLAGQLAPSLGALVAIPIIQSRLGTAQLGILTLAWAAIGYLSIFDLGFRRTLTHAVASQREANSSDLAALVWTTWWSLGGLGGLGAVALAIGTPWLAPHIVAAGPTEPGEALVALWALAASLPCVAVASGVRGVLEGQRRFDLTNVIQAPVAFASYVGPAVAALYSPSVVPAILVLAAARVLGAAGSVALVLAWHPALRRVTRWRVDAARELVATGLWMTVANVAGAAMLYLDRFMVGALAPLTMVAYYTTPQELIGKLQVISAAVSTTAFPTLTHLWSRDRARVRPVFLRTGAAIFLALFPVTAVLIVLAPQALALWLGPSFAEHASGIARWVAVGTLLNGLAAAPFALLQATGRVRLTALLQLIELPIYVVVIWVMTRSYGVEGAAAAWTLRVGVDAGLLFAAAPRSWRQPVGLDPARADHG